MVIQEHTSTIETFVTNPFNCAVTDIAHDTPMDHGLTDTRIRWGFRSFRNIRSNCGCCDERGVRADICPRRRQVGNGKAGVLARHQFHVMRSHNAQAKTWLSSLMTILALGKGVSYWQISEIEYLRRRHDNPHTSTKHLVHSEGQ